MGNGNRLYDCHLNLIADLYSNCSTIAIDKESIERQEERFAIACHFALF